MSNAQINMPCCPCIGNKTAGFVDYELPKAVASARDGWQWTSQSGAVVSGLLAGVAAQLLGSFKDKDLSVSRGAKDFLAATCYAAIFFNINATIGSFVLIDDLGEVGYEAAQFSARENKELEAVATIGVYDGNVNNLLKIFGSSPWWTCMLIHWLLTFYLGILSLIISVLTYVVLVEPTATKIVMCFIVALTIVPTTIFICFRKIKKRKDATERAKG